MERTLIYAAAGCFVGTAASILLHPYKSDPFLLFLFPLWGLILGVSIARVIDKNKFPDEKTITSSKIRIKSKHLKNRK